MAFGLGVGPVFNPMLGPMFCPGAGTGCGIVF
jgi:hypothetical protein